MSTDLPKITYELKSAAQESLERMEKYLTPAPRDWLSGALYTLLSHFYREDLPQSHVEAIARDWIAVLEDYPQWAIENARIEWLKTSDKKPKPSNIRQLCDEQIGRYVRLKYLCQRVLNSPLAISKEDIPPEQQESQKQEFNAMLANLKQKLGMEEATI